MPICFKEHAQLWKIWASRTLYRPGAVARASQPCRRSAPFGPSSDCSLPSPTGTPRKLTGSTCCIPQASLPTSICMLCIYIYIENISTHIHQTCKNMVATRRCVRHVGHSSPTLQPVITETNNTGVEAKGGPVPVGSPGISHFCQNLSIKACS